MSECRRCGDCCRHMEFGPVQFASKRPDFIRDSIDWAESHGEVGKYTFVCREDGWYFIINDGCRYLNKRTNECMRQENKPIPCREYKCKKKWV